MKLITAAAFVSLAAMPAVAPPPCVCFIHSDKTTPIAIAAHRTVYCGLDMGSNTVKLSVVSMEPGRPTTIKDERQCKRTLGLGKLSFDSTTNTARALSDEAVSDLTDTVREYQSLCTLDRGTIAAVGATQWGRDATNIADVKSRVKAATGLTFEVLTPQQEADFSYVAASVGTPGRLVVDAGSNSVEIAWQERGSHKISSILIKYGYVRGAINDFEPAPDFATGRAAYQAKAKAQIEDELRKLSPPMTLESLRHLMTDGKIGREIVALGQDGAIMHFAVRGSFRTADGKWIADNPGYDAAIARQTHPSDAEFGIMTAAPLMPRDLATYLSSLQPADFKALTTAPVNGMYGQRALANAALIDLLFRELGATRLVMVPQEVTTGNILAKLAR